ncbi:MAG TPA: hypothetical protein VMG58_18845, partial [Candidatus Sulfotelmatobacter sp.]|nr:hypothetical protein [Candidatus Sulfotelmatobacter sp.]
GERLALQTAVSARLERLRSVELPAMPRGTTLVGTAGTITTLAAVDLELQQYDPIRVNGHRLSRDRVAGILECLAALPLAERRHVAGVEPGRADVIVAGVTVCLRAVEIFGFEELTVSDGGLREGVLLDALKLAEKPGQKS